MNNLSIQSKPSLFAFTGNELVYKIKTTNRFSSQGTPAILFISVTDPGPLNGETMTIGWMDYSLQFSFNDTPDESGLQLPTNPGVNLENYLQLLIDALKTNYLLSKYYDITIESGSIQIRSKAWDSLFAFTAFESASNLVLINATQPSGKVAREGYKIMVRPVMDGEVLSEERVSMYEENDEQIAKFDISDYLKSIGASFPFPGETGTIVHDSPDLKKCWIEYAEYYENTVRKILSAESSDFFYTLPGGIDKRKLRELNDDGKTAFEYIRDRVDFLTHQPLRKYVLLNQHEVLSYLVTDSNIQTLTVKIEAKWNSGEEVEFNAESVQAGFMQLKDFDFTPFRLNLSNKDPNGQRIPDSFRFWLVDQNNEIKTVPRTYFIKDKTRYIHQFIFRNSMGRYDTVCMTGKAARTAKTNREVLTFNRSDADLTVRQFQQKHSSSKEQQSLKVNTGYLDKVTPQPDVYRDYLREFQLSREVYEIVNGELYPSLVVSSSVISQKDGEQLQFLEFEIIRAYTDEHYVRDSKLIPDQFFSPEFNYRFIK